MKRRGGNFLSAVRILNALLLSDDDEAAIEIFAHMPAKWVNGVAGKELVSMVKHQLEFYNKAKVSYGAAPVLPRPCLASPAPVTNKHSSSFRKYPLVCRSMDPPVRQRALLQVVMTF